MSLRPTANMYCAISNSRIGSYDTPLKAGYTWKLPDDKYLPITNLPSGADLTKCTVEINNVTYKSNDDYISEESDYAENQMTILNYEVKTYESYSGEKPGVGSLEIKNGGTKTVKTIQLTVTMCDISGKAIGENVLTVMGGYQHQPLKAGYTWKLESDRFYDLDNVPGRAVLSKSTVAISSVTFEQ